MRLTFTQNLRTNLEQTQPQQILIFFLI